RRVALGESQLVQQAALPLPRSVSGHALETVRLVQALRSHHPLARVEADGTCAVRARPAERNGEELSAEPTTPLTRPHVHALQLDAAVAELAERDRADDAAVCQRDPKRCVRRGRVVEVVVELRVRLEAELAQRVAHERAKADGVARLE